MILNNNPSKLQLSNNQLGCRVKILASKDGIFKTYLLRKEFDANNNRYLEAFYDIRKAYDTVNHKWVSACLNHFQIPLMLIILIDDMMSKWRINIRYDDNIVIGTIKINNGILQGDSLPIVICIAI